MGSLPKKTSQEASDTKAEASDDPKTHSKAILDSLVNSEIPTSIGSINPPVLASYVEGLPDLVKHSKNASKTNEVHKEHRKTSSSEETAVDAKESESIQVDDPVSRKKTAKNKASRGSRSPRRVTRTVSRLQELSSPEHVPKDFFDSLAWYETNKSYYDQKLQIVLDDFESSGSPDTGSGKQYYDYLLLDSRVSELSEWPGFCRAIFYAGKGKKQRAFDHTKEAARVWAVGGEATSKKVSRILDIWRGEGTVIVLTAADGLVEYEALTREALVIEALGKQRLCNKNSGSFYGTAVVLRAREKQELGATLLVKARERFAEDGAERVFAPVRLEKQSLDKDGANRVSAPVRVKQPLKNTDESAQADKEVDNAVLTAIATENYSKGKITKKTL